MALPQQDLQLLSNFIIDVAEVNTYTTATDLCAKVHTEATQLFFHGAALLGGSWSIESSYLTV